MWAAQTIVGTWAPDASHCTPIGGMVAIGSLALVSDELSCRFDRVSRERDVVSWQGRGSSGGLTSKPARVVVALRGATLALTIDGVPSGSFRRFRPQ